MRWKGMPTCGGMVVGVALAVSCREPTQITMVISTDIPCRDLRSVEVTVGDLGDIETKSPTTDIGDPVASCTDNGALGSLVVVPSGGTSDSVAFKVVATSKQRVGACAPTYGAGCVVARRSIHFFPHTPLRINVPLRASCDATPCSGVETCVAGRCVSAVIRDTKRCESADGCGEEALGEGSGVSDGGVEGGEGGGDARVVKIAAGWKHTCALLSTGAVRCWGENVDGGLGNGKSDPYAPLPVDVAGLGFVPLDLALGDNVSCAFSAATIRCWGRNSSGQLGDGTTRSRGIPGVVVMLGGNPRQLSVSAAGHACAVLDDGRVRCWGANALGQLGDGTAVDHTLPVDVDAVALDGAVAQVTTNAGPDVPPTEKSGSNRGHSCARLERGAVRCWGSTESGQCGNSTNTKNFFAPVPTPLNAGVIDLSAGGRHTCAVLASSEVRCWGEARLGQVGNGSTGTTQFAAPEPVVDLGILARQIAAGDRHTCARSLEQDRVRCWGDNSKLQMGDGDATTPRLKPVDVPLGGNVTTIAAGGFHTCALMTDGTVRCWGDNSRGQLGDGTTDPRTKPVTVLGLR